MGKSKATDEQIAAALLTCGTKRAAAAMLGITEQTIYERMKDYGFTAIYAEAKADLLRQAVSTLSATLADALNTVTGIMQDKEASPSARLQAAQIIITNTVKLADKLQEREQKAVKAQRSLSSVLGNIFSDDD